MDEQRLGQSYQLRRENHEMELSQTEYEELLRHLTAIRLAKLMMSASFMDVGADIPGGGAA